MKHKLYNRSADLEAQGILVIAVPMMVRVAGFVETEVARLYSLALLTRTATVRPGTRLHARCGMGDVDISFATLLGVKVAAAGRQ